MTYFEFYGIRPAFVLDEGYIKKKYLELSRQFHPDHFALNSIEAQTEADEKSAYNNKAYQVLSHPDLRLKYLLALKNVIQDEEVYALDQNFLMEMLDLNDLVIEDPKAAALALKDLENSLAEKCNHILTNYDDAQVTEAQLSILKDYHYKKRYILRIRENLNKFASEL